MANPYRLKRIIGVSGTFSTEVTAPNLIYNTGDQGISGGKDFYERPTVNTTGVLLSGEAYPSNNPSGFVTVTELNNVSGNLQSQIDILSVNSIAYAVALG